MKRLACCFHIHFVNPHYSVAGVCLPEACTYLRCFVISLNLISIILVHNLSTKIYYNNGSPLLNQLCNFRNTSVYCNFKLWKLSWNSSISLTDLSNPLPNLLILKGSSSPSPSQHTSVMEIHNHRRKRSLLQVIVLRPLIKQLHHCRVMLENKRAHSFNHQILRKSLLSIVIQIGLWIPWVVTCISYLKLHICILMILQISLSCVLPF